MQHTPVLLKINKFTAVCLLFSFIGLINVAEAKQNDFKETISISSGRQIADLGSNKITFTDEVEITQGSIKINADRVEIVRNEKGQIKSATAFGKPAVFSQLLDNGKPVTAKSHTIAYYPTKQTVELKNNASIEQGSSKITSDSIVYNIAKERIEASSNETSGKKGNRVTTVFIPEELKAQIDEDKAEIQKETDSEKQNESKNEDTRKE